MPFVGRPDPAAERIGPFKIRAISIDSMLSVGYYLHDSILSEMDPLEVAMDWKLELVAVPVSDVDRAKSFYVDQVGFNLDHDHTVSDDLRFVQLTPPGSACSIAIGKGLSQAAPGSVEGLQIVVADVEAARRQLVERGVDASDVQDYPWGRFVFFADPDGNRWALQQIVRPQG